MSNKISQNGINLIKEFEGCYLNAYQDSVGVWTIGYGITNADKDITGTTIYKGLKITQEQADKWLEDALNEIYVPKVIKYNSIYNWTQNELDALVSYCYNIGNIKGLTDNGTRSKQEISDDFMNHNKAGGKVLNGLTRRRKAEKELFDTKDDEGGGLMANTKEKVLNKAYDEVGYLEKRNSSNLDSKTGNAGSNNYTKYWRDLKQSGYQGQPWCQAFVDWCFMKAFGEKKAKELLHQEDGWTFYTPDGANRFKNNGQWHTTPKVGDIIYFRNSSRICHVGIVRDVDGSNVYTIEGNTSSGTAVVANGGGVFKKYYSLGNSRIAGYGRPNYSKSSSTTSSGGSSGSSSKKTIPTLAACSPMLKKGSKGTQVKYLQKDLNYVMKSGLAVDGDFGSKTQSALKSFQKKYGLEVDGIYGNKSKAKMKTLLK